MKLRDPRKELGIRGLSRNTFEQPYKLKHYSLIIDVLNFGFKSALYNPAN